VFISLSIRLARVFRFIIFLRRRLMYTRHRRGWTLTRVCSYIPLSHQHFLLHLSSFSPNCNLPHSAIAVARIHSPPPLPYPRAPLQFESRYNDLPSCLLPLPLPSGSCVCDTAIREQTGTGFSFSLRSFPSYFAILYIHLGLFSSLSFAFGESSAQT